MKLAIMTWYHYRNYGTALQVTALCEKLRDMGHEPDVIQYKPLGYFRTIPEYSVKLIAKRGFRRVFRPKITEHHRTFSSDEKERLFDEFLNEHLCFSNQCDTLSDLEELNSEYQAFICGSDQIWSPLCFDPHYFLDFVNDREKKIAYAPSFGATKIEDKYIKAETKRLLGNFCAVSVRESTGQKIIAELTGNTPELVVDPTIFFTGEEWKTRFHLAPVPSSEPYVLVYMLGNRSQHRKISEEIATRKNMRLKLIPVFENDTTREGCVTSPVGPCEFLELFQNAAYICTDSFHGLVFSLLFHKPFTVFPRFQKNDPQNQNSRVICLLEQLNLQNRMIDNKYDQKSIEQPIDYMNVDRILQKQREHSVAYLTEALHKVPKKELYRPKHVLEQNTLCCGCGACATVCPNGAIRIALNENGFFCAEIHADKCVYCGKCITVCPFNGNTENRISENADMFSFKSKQAQILTVSTSGGAAYHIARYLIQNGYLIMGCMFDCESQTAKHILVRNEQELNMIQGSKYLQSAFSDALKEAAASKNKLAIFGTPCQIAAARRVFKDRTDTIYIDLVCHGVPTYHLYEKYRDYLHRKENIQSARMQMVFRYKPKGWRDIHLYASDGNHSSCMNKADDPFFRMFEIGNCYMRACYECRWRSDSEADIRLGDYWGPRFENDSTGVSMVIAFTNRGSTLLQLLKEQGEAEISEQPINDYLTYQQKRNLPHPVFYDQLMACLRKKDTVIEDIVEKYAVPLERHSYSRKERIKHVIKMLQIRSKL